MERKGMGGYTMCWEACDLRAAVLLIRESAAGKRRLKPLLFFLRPLVLGPLPSSVWTYEKVVALRPRRGGATPRSGMADGCDSNETACGRGEGDENGGCGLGAVVPPLVGFLLGSCCAGSIGASLCRATRKIENGPRSQLYSQPRPNFCYETPPCRVPVGSRNAANRLDQVVCFMHRELGGYRAYHGA